MLTYQRAAEILRRAGNSFSRHKNVWYYMHSASADSIPKVTAILQSLVWRSVTTFASGDRRMRDRSRQRLRPGEVQRALQLADEDVSKPP